MAHIAAIPASGDERYVPSKRIKGMWRRWKADYEKTGVGPSSLGLRAFARQLLKGYSPEETDLAEQWFASKRPGGSDAQRAVRKEARAQRTERRYAIQAAKKPSSGGKDKKR